MSFVKPTLLLSASKMIEPPLISMLLSKATCPPSEYTTSIEPSPSCGVILSLPPSTLKLTPASSLAVSAMELSPSVTIVVVPLVTETALLIASKTIEPFATSTVPPKIAVSSLLKIVVISFPSPSPGVSVILPSLASMVKPASSVTINTAV